MSPWIPIFERPAPPLIDREAPRPTLFELLDQCLPPPRILPMSVVCSSCTLTF